MTSLHRIARQSRQRGAAAIEFALLSLFVFFPLLLGLIEVSRYMFLYNTVQEVTRRAAREATIRWITDTAGRIVTETYQYIQKIKAGSKNPERWSDYDI